MICGIDVDALLGGLQDKLGEAKKAALGMVNQLASDAKEAANQLKEDMETEIRSWMPELPELPELPKIPMSVELMALVSKLAGYASRLSDPKLTAEEKKQINKYISDAKKAFTDEWGPALDKKGINLDALLKVLEGGDIDPCAIIPNLQKGVDGLIKEAPKMPVFPIEGAEKEIKAVASAAAAAAKTSMNIISDASASNVDVVAKQMQKVQDPTSTKSAHDIKESRKSQTPSSSKTNGYALASSVLSTDLTDTKEHKLYIGAVTYIIVVDDDLVKPKVVGNRTYYPYYFAHEWPGLNPWFSGGYFPGSSFYYGREMTGWFLKTGSGRGSDNEIIGAKGAVELVGIMNPGDVPMTADAIEEMTNKVQKQQISSSKTLDDWYKKEHKDIVEEGKYSFNSAYHKNAIQETSKNPNGASDFYSIIYNFKIYQSTSTSWW